MPSLKPLKNIFSIFLSLETLKIVSIYFQFLIFVIERQMEMRNDKSKLQPFFFFFFFFENSVYLFI